MKKNIIIFSEYYLPKLGGVERYTNKLVEKLKVKYNITIVTTKLGTEKRIEENGNVKVYRLNVYDTFMNRYAIIKKDKWYKEVIQKIKKVDYNFCVCQTRFFPMSLIGVKFAKKNSIPVMVIEHGSSHFTVNNKILDFFGLIYEHVITSIIKSKCKLYYGVSNRCVLWLKHFKINANGVLYNSVEKDDYNKYKNYKLFDNENINICYAGRLIKEKGLYELCEAFNRIYDKNKNVVLHIAGDGPILDDLKSKYSNSNIIFLGKLDFENVMKLYNSCDIFVYPSMYPEGLPTSILEAGLMKCAIVATDRGGTVEIIKHKKNGLICEENIESIYNNLKYLIDNPDVLKMYSNNVHNSIINDFTWDITAEKLSKIIEKDGI